MVSLTYRIGSIEDPAVTLAECLIHKAQDGTVIVWADREGAVFVSPFSDVEEAIRNDIVGIYDGAELPEDIVGDFEKLFAERAHDAARRQ